MTTPKSRAWKNQGVYDTLWQDQTTPPVDLFFKKQTAGPTTLAADTVIDSRQIIVTDATGFTIGCYVGIFSANRFYFGTVLAIAGNTLISDTPLDFAFSTIYSLVICTSIDMGTANGSTTPEIYTVRGAEGNSTIRVDITRLMFRMTTDGIPDFGKFGDITSLTNGLVLRRNNDEINNIFNVKTNGDLANLAYDYTTYSASNPAQGVNGIAIRYTFAGPDKHGTAIRLAPGDSLDFIIQDNLTALESFKVIAEGHIVVD